MEPWLRPVFPTNPRPPAALVVDPRYYAGNGTSLSSSSSGKLIPRYLWVAVKDGNASLNYQIPELFQRNPSWAAHVCGNREKDLFMREQFANTSLLWAYDLIAPWAGAAKADIWRYAALWLYGGVYVDDDSDIRTPLDKVVEPLDSLIVSYERNGYNGDGCYIPRYHLSDAFTLAKNATARAMNVFNGRVIPNWLLISAPRHPVVARTMENIVEIIAHEYRRDAVLRDLKFAHKWAVIMCSTGPSVFTGSAREVVLRDASVPYKLAREDWKDFGGRFKAIYIPVRNQKGHYMNVKKGTMDDFLTAYLPEQPLTATDMARWQGEALQGQNTKQIFVLDRGKKRGIPNWDTFVGLNFTMADVRVISDAKLHAIPTGDPMPSSSSP
jgi:hypothetical protein